MPDSLTERENRLLKQAGDRVFTLARQVAALEQEKRQLQQTSDHLEALLNEVRRSRDVLSAQVESLLIERDRDYEERAELRRLLAATSAWVQSTLNAPRANEVGRAAPQKSVERGRTPERPKPTPSSDVLGRIERGWKRLRFG